jgi:hypothetical protein
MVPRDVTIAVVEDELPYLHAYARRHAWSVAWSPDDLRITAVGIHPGNHDSVHLHADLAGYRAQPPAWTFVEDPERPGGPCFPAPGSLPGGVGSVFHSHRVICAPFNRLAFSVHSGPHGDWGGPGDWLNVRGKVRATTLAAMLTVIVAHLQYSPGWLS